MPAAAEGRDGAGTAEQVVAQPSPIRIAPSIRPTAPMPRGCWSRDVGTPPARPSFPRGSAMATPAPGALRPSAPLARSDSAEAAAMGRGALPARAAKSAAQGPADARGAALRRKSDDPNPLDPPNCFRYLFPSRASRTRPTRRTHRHATQDPDSRRVLWFALGDQAAHGGARRHAAVPRGHRAAHQRGGHRGPSAPARRARPPQLPVARPSGATRR